MIYNTFTKNLLYSIIYSLIGLICLSGCTQPDYKSQADKTVYNIIDQKWQDDFGSKVNYKISDTEPLPNDIKVEKAVPATGVLTLADAVAIATAHNRQYQTERETLYIKALELRLARHDFDPQYFGGRNFQYLKDGGDESFATDASIGFEQLLAKGARISTNVTAAWVEILTGNARSGLISLLSATITQPLLRGSGSEIVMENLTQAERDTVYQIRSFNRFRKTLVVLVVSQYYRVLQLSETVENAQNNYETLVNVNQRAEKLAKAGRLPQFELNQARQDKLEARDTLVQVQKQYQQALDEFKLILSLPTGVELKLDENELAVLSISGLRPEAGNGDTQTKEDLSDEAIDLLEKELELLELIRNKTNYSQNGHATEDTYIQAEKMHEQVLDQLKTTAGLLTNARRRLDYKQPDFSETDAVTTALALRLDLANQADFIYDAERKVIVAADSLRSDLSLTATTDVVSSARRRSSIFGKIENNTALGLELDLPLERMFEANEYRKALITLTQTQRNYEQAIDTVVLEVRQTYRDLTEAAERHRIQLESLALAEKRFKNTFLLLQYSRANTRDVLDAQEDLFDAQNAAAETLVDHAVAVLSFYRDVGAIQVRPDGMWSL